MSALPYITHLRAALLLSYSILGMKISLSGLFHQDISRFPFCGPADLRPTDKLGFSFNSVFPSELSIGCLIISKCQSSLKTLWRQCPRSNGSIVSNAQNVLTQFSNSGLRKEWLIVVASAGHKMLPLHRKLQLGIGQHIQQLYSLQQAFIHLVVSNHGGSLTIIGPR